MKYCALKSWQLLMASVILSSAGAAQASADPPTAPHVEVNIETKYEWGVIRSLCPEVSAMNGKAWSEARKKLAQRGITELAPNSVEYGVLARYYARYKAKDSSIHYIFAAKKDTNILFALKIKSGKLVGHQQGFITTYERANCDFVQQN